MANIMVLGAGGWGTAISIMCARYGHAVRLWSHSDKEVEILRRDRENRRLLPGVRLPDDLKLTADIGETGGADIVVMAVPSSAVRETAKKLAAILPNGAIVVNAAKGLEEGSLKRLTQVLGEELPDARAVVLSGPSHAEEVSRGVPTAAVAASVWPDAAARVQDVFMNPDFRIYVNPDVVGVELGGALKNVIALAAGICDGLGLGDNTKAALMTRGISEMARLGVAMGGRAQTFAGLTGFGDLIVTCTSTHSRNHRAGVYIGQGLTAEQAVEKVGMTVEGYRTARAAYQLSLRMEVEMPIVCECYRMLYEGSDPDTAIRNLMQREKKHEIEDIWLTGPETG